MKRLTTHASIALALGLALTVTLLWLLGYLSTRFLPSPWLRAEVIRAQSPKIVLAQGPTIRHVAPAPTGDDSGNDCANNDTPCATIQAAMDAADDGDVIKVATGTYTGVSARSGVTQVVYISKTVTVRGGYITTDWNTPYPITQPTTLDAQGQGRVIYITGDIYPTVEGLRITGGDAAGQGGCNDMSFGIVDAGGGIYIVNTTAIISNNQVFSNTASIGGGLFLWRSDATISGNSVTANVADMGMGGGLGLMNSDATLSGNTVTANTAKYGGGLYIGRDSDGTLSGNIITANTAKHGGGLYLFWFSDPAISGNTIFSNTATNSGGGLVLENSDAVLDNNFVTDNGLSSGHGSGLYMYDSSPLLRHNTIARNHGGWGEGLYVTGTGSSQLQLYNTILVSHTVGIAVTAGKTAMLESTLWYSNGNDTEGPGIITRNDHYGDPAFVAPDAGNYHIRPGSAAIDMGVYLFIDDDVDGEPRPMAFGPDIGADEHLGPGLQLHTSAWQNACNPGRTVTYTLVVTGVGTGAVSDVILTDTLPPEQRAIATAASTGDCATAATPVWDGQVTCTLGTLNVGDGARITLTAQVTTTLPSALPWRMRNRVWVTGTQASNFAYADVYLQDCHVRLNDGTSEWEDVQAAVDASARPTDVVKVAGVCAGINTRGGVRQVVYISKTVTIRGGYSYSPTNWTAPDPVASPTTLDARGRGRVLYITGDINPTVEGLCIASGDADGLGGYTHQWGMTFDAGGGMYILDAPAIISNNRVFSNTAQDGGGLFLSKSAATLNGNTVSSNNSAHSGGGLFLKYSAATLTGNIITANTASDGGGLFLWRSNATISGNSVTANTAHWGGGLNISWHSDATLSGNTIFSNTATSGGGGLVLSYYSGVTLNGNTVTANSADRGGGLYLNFSDATLINNVVADNRGGREGSGLHIVASSPRLLHTTIANNSGGDGSGLYATYGYRHPYGYASSVAMTNTIVATHTVGVCVTAGSTATLESTLWHGNTTNWGGAGTINRSNDHTGDPAFVAPNAGDYHIGLGSAAIDAGVNARVPADIDGDPRPFPFDSACDIGADELVKIKIYLPIVLKNHRTWDAYCEDNDHWLIACGPLVPSQTYMFYPDDTEDYYYFELSAPATVNVSVTDFMPTSTWGDLLLYGPVTGDECGELIDHFGIPGHSSMSLGPHSLESGKYYIRVYTTNNHSTTQLYSLMVTY